MAIKTSNQITFIEHKKIVEIKEWYLATPENDNITINTYGWTTDIQTMDYTNKYLWNYEEVVYSIGSSDISDPVIIGVYGDSGSSLQVKYISSATIPVVINNDVSKWSDDIPTPVSGERVYMIQKMSTDTTWSTPMQISAEDGMTPSVSIVDGYWNINGEITDVKAEGDTPTITVGKNGNWFVDGVDTGSKAQGEIGKDGASIEYVYYRSQNSIELDAPFYTDGKLTQGWTDSPHGITQEDKYEYVSVRTKSIGQEWGPFSKPVVWAKWGDKGQDGDGVQYEYYLTNESDVTKIPGWSATNNSWTDEPQGVTSTKQYEYVVQIKTTASGSTVSKPALWAKYSEDGSSLQMKYISSATVPTITNNNVSQWHDTIPVPVSGQKIYMTQKLSSGSTWSTPIQISAEDGITPTITIVNGYWSVNGESTGIKAEGDTPEITIGSNGNWYINGVDSGNKAQGDTGKDGASIEYVYYRNKTETSLSVPSYTNGSLTSGWTVSPQGITETYKYEYVSVRNKPLGGSWGTFSTPVIWSKWGEKGQDGDGIQYEYYLTSESNVSKIPAWSAGNASWTDEPQGVTKDKQYEYVVQIKTTNGSTIVSSPSLWSKFGEDGLGISQIKNYYLTTKDAQLPITPEWKASAPLLSPTNKYLWNYEQIIYTDNSSTSTDPVIIGVYGDSGVSVITFDIYSTHGFVFKENIGAIELKVAAFDGNTPITGATYTWSWWNVNLNNGDGGYSIIDNAASLIVPANSQYAASSIKCSMEYNGELYEDFVSLSSETTIYTSVVKFFDGSNIFSADDLYLVAYVELYQNNRQIETISAPGYYSGVSTLNSSGVITSNVKGSFTNGDRMYFICQNNNLYNVALCEYTSGQWKKVDLTTQYTYTNSLYPSIKSNVIAISKEDIDKSQNIDFTISKGDTFISKTHTNVIDSNDPIVGDTPPSKPVNNQLWLNTSLNPHVLQMFVHGEGWIDCSQKIGGAIFTSKPSSYSDGDLWILANGEKCGNFGPGSMLKATTSSSTFNTSHWIDADNESTELKNNIKQYFSFSASTGLRIGSNTGDANEDKFYVNISSDKMGFYEGDTEVVSISQSSANIDNLTVEKGFVADCSSTLKGDTIMQKTTNSTTYKYIWKVEENGSLSLSISN